MNSKFNQKAVSASDATACSPSYLADDVTVGQLIRWVNDEVMKAGKNEDMDMIRAMIRVSNGVETALESYRFAQNIYLENAKVSHPTKED